MLLHLFRTVRRSERNFKRNWKKKKALRLIPNGIPPPPSPPPPHPPINHSQEILKKKYHPSLERHFTTPWNTNLLVSTAEFLSLSLSSLSLPLLGCKLSERRRDAESGLLLLAFLGASSGMQIEWTSMRERDWPWTWLEGSPPQVPTQPILVSLEPHQRLSH